jgi:hypothetical protein
MIKNKAMQLVKALRSGEYEQGKGVLVNDEDQFCCLGVACNISKQDLEWVKRPWGTWYIGEECTILPKSIQKEFGFYSVMGKRSDYKSLEIGYKKYSSLARANDGGCTFEQIADYIEKHYEYL